MEEQDLKQKIAGFLEAGEGFKNETLENLNLSVRTYHCLLRKNIKCLEDVRTHKESLNPWAELKEV